MIPVYAYAVNEWAPKVFGVSLYSFLVDSICNVPMMGKFFCNTIESFFVIHLLLVMLWTDIVNIYELKGGYVMDGLHNDLSARKMLRILKRFSPLFRKKNI